MTQRFIPPFGTRGTTGGAKKSTPKERGAGVLGGKEHQMDAGGMDGGDGHHEEIHEHLRNMHEATGHAHSHIEHHEDGSHTSHHIDEGGEMHGPHDHANLEALKDHMDNFLDEEGKEGEHEGGY